MTDFLPPDLSGYRDPELRIYSKEYVDQLEADLATAKGLLRDELRVVMRERTPAEKELLERWAEDD